MESNREALLWGILEDPFDMTRRKVFADFLEESGEYQDADIIRRSLELGEHERKFVLSPEYHQTRHLYGELQTDISYTRKFYDLLKMVKDKIYQEFGDVTVAMHKRCNHFTKEWKLHFDDGFVSRVRCSKPWLLYCATECFKRHPITKLDIVGVRRENRFKFWFGGGATQQKQIELNSCLPDFGMNDIVLPCHVGAEILLEVPLQQRGGGEYDYISNIVVDYFRVINDLPPICLKDSMDMFIQLRKAEKELNSKIRLTIH